MAPTRKPFSYSTGNTNPTLEFSQMHDTELSALPLARSDSDLRLHQEKVHHVDCKKGSCQEVSREKVCHSEKGSCPEGGSEGGDGDAEGRPQACSGVV